MNAATILTAICTAATVLVVAPPREVPTFYLDDLTDRDIQRLMKNAVAADEISAEDFRVLCTLEVDRVIFEGILHTARKMKESNPNDRMSWATITEILEKSKEACLKRMAEEEEEMQNKARAIPSSLGGDA